MKFNVLTLFPEMFSALDESIIGRGKVKGLIDINLINIRDFSKNKHKKVDDTPYGGGAGMVMEPTVVYDAYCSVKEPNVKVIYMSPQGKTLNQQMVQDLAKEENIILLCGHYEGIDQRVIDEIVDEEISIGDYVLTGGELPAMVLIDSVSRYVEGVLKEDSVQEESFTDGLLEYPQYTRPEVFLGKRVPEVLLSGHHENIKKWRRNQSIINTYLKRPDLLKEIKLSDKEQKMLHEIERAAFLHFNHRDKEVAVVVPESDTNDLEEELKKAQDEHNKIIGDVNKSRADYNEAKDKLDELIAEKKEQDKKAEPPVNPFDNSETATIKATRWECKFQGYAKKGLVKIATSTAFGKRIYDNLRAKRAEKYAKKLNRLQEVYDVANANYNRIEGNYNRIANEISNMQNLIDQKLEFERLQQKVNNEKKSVQIIMQRRVALFKKSLDLLNIPDDQKQKISETEVRQMLETKSDQMSKEMLGQLKKYADLMKKANNAMKKDAEELANVKNQYHQRLKQHGYDSATDSKNLEIQIMTRLDKAKEEQQNFDYSQLETLSNDRALAEKKLNQFKDYVQRNGATITPVEVELNPDELTERKVKSSAPKQNRFSVWFDGLKQRFSRNKDE